MGSFVHKVIWGRQPSQPVEGVNTGVWVHQKSYNKLPPLFTELLLKFHLHSEMNKNRKNWQESSKCAETVRVLKIIVFIILARLYPFSSLWNKSNSKSLIGQKSKYWNLTHETCEFFFWLTGSQQGLLGERKVTILKMDKGHTGTNLKLQYWKMLMCGCRESYSQ